MSAANRTAGPSTDNFTAIFSVASTEYQRLTGKSLDTHRFATQLDTCQSPEAISIILRTQAQAFSKFREGDERLMAWLDPTIHILLTFSDTLGEGIGLAFSPAKTIFTGISVLLGAVKDVAENHDTLIHLFERIHFFVQRLKSYTGMELTNESTELLGKIMAQLLRIVALSTKAMTDKRIKKIMKKLVGRKDVEEALSQLDMLTKEESLMVVVRNLEITQHVDGNVKATKILTEDIDDNVKATKVLTEGIEDSVNATKVLTEDIDDNVKATKVLAEGIEDNINATKVLTEDIDGNVKAAMVLVEDNAKEIEGVARRVDNVTYELKRNQMPKELRLWLSPPDPSINHNTACKTQHGGTAMWFIQGDTFQDWKRNGSLLWVRGNPGAGKSILCSAIIEDIKNMQEARPVLMAYYYFDFKDVSKRGIHGLLTSLLFQLGDSSDGCRDVLHKMYTSCRDGSEQPSDAALVGCLKRMLELPGQLPIFLILDALDECLSTTGTPSPREEVLDFLEDLVGSSYSNLFICVTSRPEQDIQTVLNPLTPASRLVSLHEEGGQRDDIRSYVDSFVHKDRTMRRWREEDRNLVISTLIERAGGMFRWAFCQLDTLRRCMPSSIRKALNELPTTLDETYERVLQEIPKEKRQHAHHLFQCLVVAIRPLRVEELGELFAIEFDEDAGPSLKEDWRPENAEDAVLSACSTLIAVIENEGSKIVQFSHFSVKEYLTSDRLRTSGMDHYHIPLDTAHTILARACLTVLLQLDESVDKKRLEAFPLAFYAAQHWVDHAKYEDVATRFQVAMKQIFNPRKPYFAAWIWIHDVDSNEVQKTVDDLKERPKRPRATALYYAALCGFSGLADYLIATHAGDVHAKCGNLGSPLHAASYKGNLDATRLLLARGADLNLTNKKKGALAPLYSAYDGGHLDVMQLLLEHGANVDAAPYSFKESLLHVASTAGRPDVVQLLLQHNANANARNSIGQTPLHNASIHGKARVTQLLLEHGAIVNAQDGSERRGCTSLHDASRKGRLEVVQVLLEHGADVHIRGTSGTSRDSTPFQVATSEGHVEVAQLLLEHGAKKE